MKRLITLFITVCLVLTWQPWTASAEFTKTKIAVLDFQMQGEKFDNPDMGTIVAEWFITAMVREGRFDVVERRLLEKVLSEQKLAMSGVIDANSATQLGKLLGVKVIITGSIMKLKDAIEINARIIDVESASIIAAENFRSVVTTRLQDLVGEMSKKIIKNFPLEGYVVNRSGGEVTLDLGLRSGVKKGMKFFAYREGKVIKHPKTGVILDVEQIQTGFVTITDVMQNICKATIDEETSPGSINYGQQVKSLADTTPKPATLTIDTVPEDARIRILNITPPYVPGIALRPGIYHVEVSANGFQTSKEWVNLAPNEQKSLTVHLTSAGTPQTASPSWSNVVSPQLTPAQEKYLRMLNSKSERAHRDAAKLITRSHLRDTVVLDIVEQKLLAGYRQNGNDREHVDTMSWFCKALGASGQNKYRAALSTVAHNAAHRKLRDYAAKSLKML